MPGSLGRTRLLPEHLDDEFMKIMTRHWASQGTVVDYQDRHRRSGLDVYICVNHFTSL